MRTLRSQTLFVGVDVHKDAHTAVGLTPYGEKVFEMTISNEEADFVGLVEQSKVAAASRGFTPTFGLEDVHSCGERLSSFLVSTGVPVVAIPPVLVDRRRANMTHPEKNDSLDAHGVAEVMIQRIDSLPVYTLSEEARKARQIRELSLEREWFVKEQTRIKNQLHLLLHRIWNTGYRAKFKDPFSQKALAYWRRAIPKDTDAILVRRTKRALRRLSELRGEIADIEEELTALIEKGGYTLQTASGCGTVVTAEIVGEIGDIARFRSPASLAKYAGCAPREHSSGKKTRWRKTRGGNRRLNRAFHRMALSQLAPRSGNDAAKEYFSRKLSEGKSKPQALVCLRRQLVNVVWMMLTYKTEYRYPQP